MKLRSVLPVLCALGAGALLGWTLRGTRVEAASNRVFELRTYTSPEGKLPELLARFRDHTVKLFEKHGMTNVGYWVPSAEPGHSNTLVYMLAFPSKEAADKSWAAFRADPEWTKVRTDSEVNGKLTTKVESVFLDPADFSPAK